MLLPYSARLRAANVQIVLASLSPRRKELMGLLLPPAPSASSATAAAASSSSSSTPAVAAAPLPVPFSCVPSSFAEDLSHAAYPTAASYACATSLAKAREVWARVGSHSDLLIAADTVVTLDGKILEKPACQSTVQRTRAAAVCRHDASGCTAQAQLETAASCTHSTPSARFFSLSVRSPLFSSSRWRLRHASITQRPIARRRNGRDAARA